MWNADTFVIQTKSIGIPHSKLYIPKSFEISVQNATFAKNPHVKEITEMIDGIEIKTHLIAYNLEKDFKSCWVYKILFLFYAKNQKKITFAPPSKNNKD